MHAAEPIHHPLHESQLGAPARTEAMMMRAVVRTRYGEPEVLTLAELPRPTPGPGEVLVRVHAANVNVGDHHVVTGRPYLIRVSPFGGLPRPRHRVPGAVLSGVVVEVGADVTSFKPGDAVMGQAAHGAFAEYVAVPASRLAAKPETLSFDEAAAVPWGITALQALRDVGRLAPGQRVLINGASGAVGTWAVQIAKALGAEVTAVCSSRHVDLMRELGAAEVIDYTREDFVAASARYDLLLDTVGNRTLGELRSVLTPRGTYLACSGGGGDWVGPFVRLVAVLVSSLFTSQRLKPVMTTPNAADFEALRSLVEAGAARPVVERRYALHEVGDALRHIGNGHAQGLTVLHLVD